MTNYVPLTIKSEYSHFGIIKFEELYKYLAQNNIKAFAVADSDYLRGAGELFFKKKELIFSSSIEDELKKKIEEIKPILGYELWIKPKDSKESSFSNINLYAKNDVGYHNLVKICSIATTKGFYLKPSISYDLIEKYKEGLICISGNSESEIQKQILNENIEKAKDIAKYYKSLFNDDFYISLSDYGLEVNKKTNTVLMKIAQDSDIKAIIANEVYYLKKEDADFHDTFLCTQTNSFKFDKNRLRFSTDEFYLKSEKELKEAFYYLDDKNFEDCINNTKEIANKCTFNFENELNKNLIPKFDVPDGFNSETYLEKLVKNGLKQRYGKPLSKEIIERAEYELDIINKNNFADYFLILWDIVHYAKTHSVQVGPGRRSAPGSIVLYALKITDIDPIKYNLLFERFLNPESMLPKPPVEIDFGNPEKIIRYIIKKYGKEKVSRININHFHNSKSAFLTVGKILNISKSETDKYVEILNKSYGADCWQYIDIRFINEKLYNENPTIITESSKEISYKYWADTAEKLIFRHSGTSGQYCAKIVISPCDIKELLPIEKIYGDECKIKTQFEEETLNKLGILHYDFLCFGVLNETDKIAKLIKKRKNINININKIPLDEERVFQMLSNGDTEGIFLFDSQGMSELIKRLNPDSFDDLGALVALYRPGSLRIGMTDRFIQSKHNPKYIHPLLEHVLKNTYGEIIYQEQTDRLWNIICGGTLGQAELIRKRILRKQNLEELKAEFVECACKKGFKQKYAEKIFDEILATDVYCFNKSHSDSYALFAYQQAYLKCLYRDEYSFIERKNDEQHK